MPAQVSAAQSQNWSPHSYTATALTAEHMGSAVEAYTGLDIDGDGQSDNVLIPKYDPSTHDFHLVISTVEGGYNSGRVYIHVVPYEEAQMWLDNLIFQSKQAKIRYKREQLYAIYGHSKYALLRARTHQMHQSISFQSFVATLIVLGFLLEIADSQVHCMNLRYLLTVARRHT